ncbi:alpha/beta hydrolase-fold protein [Aquimarina algiphila]|uniref:alpha/beta hydrolase-fold protein n=1 Tax=Aquimarina algiphila TaxID=2047982 RepID=UPI00232E301F|nr:alpha/beta hydrolase-fold protein [Aquimarina algiphila]
MKILKNHVYIIYTLILFVFLLSQLSNAQVISKEPEDLFIVGTESIRFRSEINNSDYTLHINLPENYINDPTKTYPVFYALDGYRIFGVTTHIYKGIWDDGFAPEIIIVGITNSGSKTSPTLHRTRDLTPTAIERISTSGGASTFLKVLSDEIIPLIDRNYRSDKTNRTLAGTSFAGLFTHYTLFTQPSLFTNYIINNPTLWWDDDYPYQLEEAFYQKNKSLHANVIFLNSEYNDMPKAIKMFDQIKRHNYNHLTLDFRMIENMGHLGGEAEAMNQGMRFAYKRPAIKVPEKALKQYCGTYQDGAYVREIVIRDGELTLIRTGDVQGAKIQVINETEFAILGRYFDFHFNRDEKGNVISFSSQFDTDPSRTRTAIKIK